ncbi:MAG: hypothetical protein HYU39_07395 [Thaumarchaeota archaeon]|nr:hypothetical protein [Nitrososphaerota archaeon]
MLDPTVDALKRIFKEHYFKHSDRVEVPIRMSEREFGYWPFGGGMIRHLSFKTPGELIATLVKEAPKGAYYSCGYYHEPTLPMAEKGWKSGDLVFDIDADDLDSPCKKEHDRWTCKKCPKMGIGIRPEKCPACGNTRIAQLNWVCYKCLDASKREVFKLLDMLEGDFGVEEKCLRTYFSGNMGYHISVEDKIMEDLNQESRGEIVDYVVGIGLLPSIIGVAKQSSYEYLSSKLPSDGEEGWRGRIAGYLKDYELKGLEGSGGGDAKAKILSIYKKSGYERFRKLLEQASRAAGVAIDPNVTTDIHRIFRMPGTLHGESGLEKMKVENLERFDPFVDPVLLKDEEVKVSVKFAPPFTLRGVKYGPYSKQEVVLPEAAAVYLMGKGLAQIVAGSP